MGSVGIYTSFENDCQALRLTVLDAPKANGLGLAASALGVKL